MIRLVLGLIALGGLAWLAMVAADQPGSVTINWMDMRIQASLVVLLLAVLAVIVLIWLIARLWSWLKGGTPLSPERRALRRSKKGLNEVDAALSALAAGDSKKALSLAQHAIDHLGGAGIAYVVAAQAATANGRSELAEEYFNALSETEHGRFLGLRGRVSEARRLGHVSKALELSEEALTEAPRSDWAIATAFELEAKLGKWAEAEQTLRKATAKSIFDAETSAHHMGAVRYGEALKARDDNRLADAARLAKQALSVRPGFAPAAVLAADLFKTAGKARQATSVLQKAWKVEPHPAIAQAYAALMPMETASARLKRFEALVKPNPDHPESRLRLAEAALGAGETKRARDILKPALEGLARARAGVIMGQVAAADGAGEAERARWADVAQRGAPEPSYSCSVCRTQRALWTSHCPNCDSFNTLDWGDAAGGPHLLGDDPVLHLVGTAPAALPAPDDVSPDTQSGSDPDTIEEDAKSPDIVEGELSQDGGPQSEDAEEEKPATAS